MKAPNDQVKATSKFQMKAPNDQVKATSKFQVKTPPITK